MPVTTETLLSQLMMLSDNEKITLSDPVGAEHIRRDQTYHKYTKSRTSAGDEAVTYLFEDDYFLDSADIIGIYRHDRFVPVLPHKHNYIELNYIWQGQCIQYINEQQVICHTGDLCILDTQAVHSIEPAREEDLIINILMRKEFFATTFLSRMNKQGILSEFLLNAVTHTHNTRHYLKFATETQPLVRHIMTQILLEFYNRDIGCREAIDSQMSLLFTQLLRLYRDEQGNASQSQDVRLLTILDYIERHFETCTLQSTARHFGFNPKYLTTWLKSVTGRSFLEHIHDLKMDKARILLSSTDLSVNEIISLCGYQNMNFFYKKFKQAYKCTPLEYRLWIRQSQIPGT